MATPPCELHLASALVSSFSSLTSSSSSSKLCFTVDDHDKDHEELSISSTSTADPQGGKVLSTPFHSDVSYTFRGNHVELGPTMAWRSGGATNADLVGNLFKNGLITSSRVRDAMSQVDRAHYCPDPRTAYEDAPQLIGHRATISAPHMHAHAVESLLPFLQRNPSSAPFQRGIRVLDVGSGSGYLTAVLAELVFDPESNSHTNSNGNDDIPKGTEVIGIEHIDALTQMGAHNMRKSPRGRSLLESGRVKFVTGDGRKGYTNADKPSAAPLTGDGKEDTDGFDAIHVGAGASFIHPELMAQLRTPGRMFIPVEDESGSGGQHIWVVDKDAEGNITKEKQYGVSYVPLTDAPS